MDTSTIFPILCWSYKTAFVVALWVSRTRWAVPTAQGSKAGSQKASSMKQHLHLSSGLRVLQSNPSVKDIVIVKAMLSIPGETEEKMFRLKSWSFQMKGKKTTGKWYIALRQHSNSDWKILPLKWSIEQLPQYLGMHNTKIRMSVHACIACLLPPAKES